jgi:DNA-binding CsgD family transcriptional regulator/tetratricopeptide (TPR) repeat protein
MGWCVARVTSTVSTGATWELLEREDELGTLAAFVHQLSDGSGGLVAIEGPAGIGKSRLLTECRDIAQRAGLEVLAARGVELEQSFPFGVVRQLLEPAVARLSPRQRSALLSGVAEPARLLLDPTVAGGDAEDASFAILHGLFWVVAALGARSGRLLAVDDLHWCDPASLRFLAYLLPRLHDMPVGVAVALRPHEESPDRRLLQQILSDELTRILRPAPLTTMACGHLAETALGSASAAAFSEACRRATEGNPLLMRELLRALAAERALPDEPTAHRVVELGGRAAVRWVAGRLAPLSPDARALAVSVAVLGDDASLETAAALARLPAEAGLEVRDELVSADVLRDAGGELAFVHPVVRRAVEASLPAAELEDWHARAVELLVVSGRSSEVVAAHILRVSGTGDAQRVETLRRAAREALQRGSPEVALAYLERALEEPPNAATTPVVLAEAGSAALLVDVRAATRHLAAARDLAADSDRRGALAELLGHALFLLNENSRAVEIYREALEELPEPSSELARKLSAGLIRTAMRVPELLAVAIDEKERARLLPTQDSLGARLLAAVTAYHDARSGSMPGVEIVTRARNALEGDMLVGRASGSLGFWSGMVVLIAADDDEADRLLDLAFAAAHTGGSMTAAGDMRFLRSMRALWRGALGEAEEESREAMRLAGLARADPHRLYPGAFLALALVEQGRVDDAASVIDETSPDAGLASNAHALWHRFASAETFLAQGRTELGLETMLECGRRAEALGIKGPALLPWRTSAAMALVAIGKSAEAQRLASEELQLARLWGAPRALGRALRVHGVITGAEGMPLLDEAVTLLEHSSAVLEHARARVDLGSAFRRAGLRKQAREHLLRGLELAELCGALPLVAHTRTELRAAGARPRRSVLTGLAALTPSERRVAELAAGGKTNREIAQTLFVTTKTVEVHLSSSYRKLDVRGRRDLSRALSDDHTQAR